MTDAQRKCFLSVSEYCNFSKAANALYVSQPAVSKHINALERELEVSLFARQGKYIRLTEAGEILRDFIIKYNKEYDDALARIKSLKTEALSGTVTVGCCFVWDAPRFFTPLAAHFSSACPNMHLNIEALEPDELISALRGHELDAALCYSATLEKQTDISSVPFGALPAGFICSGRSVSLGAGVPELRDLEDQPFIVIDSLSEKSGRSFFSALINDLCLRAGFVPRLRHCRRMSSAVAQVSCGSGVLLADSWYSAASSPELRYIPAGVKLHLSLAYMPSSPNPLTPLFIAEALRAFESSRIG